MLGGGMPNDLKAALRVLCWEELFEPCLEAGISLCEVGVALARRDREATARYLDDLHGHVSDLRRVSDSWEPFGLSAREVLHFPEDGGLSLMELLGVAYRWVEAEEAGDIQAAGRECDSLLVLCRVLVDT